MRRSGLGLRNQIRLMQFKPTSIDDTGVLAWRYGMDSFTEGAFSR